MDDPNTVPERTIRCCFLGDAAVGKTRMILASAKKSGSEEQMFFTYATTMEIDGAQARVELCDTQDGPEWQEQRQRVCNMSDLIFLCYSVVSPSSLDSVITKWAPAIRALNKPIILLGNKTDMRTNEELVARLQSKNLKPVTKADGQKAAETLGALCFFEISCKEPDPLSKVFSEGLLVVFGPNAGPNKKKTGKPTNCNVM